MVNKERLKELGAKLHPLQERLHSLHTELDVQVAAKTYKDAAATLCIMLGLYRKERRVLEHMMSGTGNWTRFDKSTRELDRNLAKAEGILQKMMIAIGQEIEKS